MNLKRLELRGFKTFALPTEFVFSPGITAVVGPNGSGKSNLADAMRWVLGEQSLRAVRGRRTEDVIFAGGGGRAPAGMAEVSITFDNTSGRLPLAFSEVTISRRAYRSGENEYLLNGSRVRLRDLVDVLLKAGLTESGSAVIGQGMVDQVLSLRAEERRGLIDEAADIKRYHVKLEETREKLATTEQGLARAKDILAEIGPRLVSLAEQASRLRQHASLTNELREAQRGWHGQVRGRLESALAGIAARQAEEERAAATLRRDLELRAQRLTEIESEETTVRQSSGEWQRGADALRQRNEEVRRRSAVLGERGDALRRLRAELTADREAARKALEAAEGEWQGVQAGCHELEGEIEILCGELGASEARHGAELRQAADQAARIASLREQIVRANERAVALGSQCRVIEERLAALEEEAARCRAARLANTERVALVAVRGTKARERVEQASAQLQARNQEATGMRAEIVSGEAALQLLAGQARRVGQELDRQRAQLEALERWQDSQAAYSVGVRAVLQAARQRGGQAAKLTGVVGVAVDLLQVPQPLETAIEVALGGRAQDIVVETWRDAEAAIAFLKSGGAGRSTFLPLDTLRVGTWVGNAAAVKERGVHGVAAELVDCDARYRRVVEHLLGRTLVADDLGVARRVLGLCPQGWQIVTIEGEIVRTSGAVTGGARRGSETGLLARQRELRALREAALVLDGQNATAAAQLSQARDAQTQRRRRLATIDDARRLGEATLRRAEAEVVEIKGEERALADEGRWAGAAAARVEDEHRRLEGDAATATRQLAELGEQEAAAREMLSGMDSEQEAHAQEQREAAEEVAEQRTGLAVKERELAGRRELLATLEAGIRRARTQIGDREARLAELMTAEEIVAAERGEAMTEMGALAAEVGRLEGMVGPALARLGELEASRRAFIEEGVADRARLAEVEATGREAEAGVRRCHEQIAEAQAQAEEELGAAVAAEIWRGNGASEAVAEGMLPEDIKRQVDRLRTALRNLGMVNPQAIAEHEETAARHDFLANQVRDMEEAIGTLRRLAAELQVTMRQRFEETFARVAGEFRRYFNRLFGGGTARLVLTLPGDISQTGIDIVAQPPGRRLQNLSLLSGGERALTAVALLFAVLAVRPVPFCVLDEVDAALDEANVGRFGAALQELAQHSQFVVITHNRGTMEAAANLYGITMPADGISRVISLRLSNAMREEEEVYVRPVATPR